MEDKKQGGQRENAGRKSKFGEAAVTLRISVPKSKEVEIRAIFEAILKPYEKK